MIMPINEEEYIRDCVNCYEHGWNEAVDEIKETLARLVINGIIDNESYEIILEQIRGV